MTEEVIQAPPLRDAEGKFVPGVSGNPKGRPLGVRNKSTEIREAIEAELLTMLQTDSTEILQVAIARAKKGNDAMLKLLLDKVLSPRKAEEGQTSKASPVININISKTDDAPTFIDGEAVKPNEE